HVIDEPLVAALEHPVIDRNLRALLGDELGAHDRALALDGLAGEMNFLTAVQLDLRDVGALEQVREERAELALPGLSPRCPVPRQGPLGRLGEVEDVVRDPPDRRATIPLPAVLLQLRVVQDLDRAVDLGTELIGRRASPGPLGPGHYQWKQ